MEETRITVKEIARLAGVSIGTVDRVLHDRGGVSLSTKRRIDEIIGSLGYEPNMLARQLSLNRNYEFRALLPHSGQDSGYWALCLEGVQRAAKELSPYRVRVRVDQFDRYDRQAYGRLLEDVVRQPCDGLLIAPVLPRELAPALERLKGLIPYVFFDGSVEGAAPIATIGQDAFRAGCLAGRVMSLLAGGSYPLVALNAHAEDSHIRLRIKGFASFFGGQGAGPNDVFMRDFFETEDTEAYGAYLDALFDALPGIRGILVANASGHIVGDWLVRKGLKTDCRLVAWDLVPANVHALSTGAIDCLVSQRPADQAKEGLERLFRSVVHRAEVGGVLKMPLDLFFKENLPEPAQEPAAGT
ncbi:MAG TPA: substrate-binding domain-containing protein [Rectinemataceae bacterium]|nr:substrate-binding domain-containing protein [Rectinemataceae bacterium]